MNRPLVIGITAAVFTCLLIAPLFFKLGQQAISSVHTNTPTQINPSQDTLTPTTIITPGQSSSPTITATPTPTNTVSPTLSPAINNTPDAGSTQISPVDGMAVVYIPSGEFSMGMTSGQLETLFDLCSDCVKDDFFPSTPAHQVHVDSYWIYQTEVTNSMYLGCVNAGVCRTPEKSSGQTRSSYFGDANYGDYPVVYVNWFDAERYCNWAGGRLSTEAEWEKAARGIDGRLFPWGNQAPNTSLTNIYPFIGDTVAVGSYPTGASPYGVLDMVGNVYEWIADWYSPNYYESSDFINPPGPQSGEMGRRSVRGGSWGWGIPFASTLFRDWWEPEKTGSGVGFRCVLDEIP